MPIASQPATSYLTLADVLAMHDVVTERTGAAQAPLRDEGLLDSALTRPRYAAHYGGADLARQAAVLGIGISQAQSFVDGNKRTAYAAVEVFLDINGLRLSGAPLELARAFEAVAERADDLDAATARFEAWLRERLTPTRA